MGLETAEVHHGSRHDQLGLGPDGRSRACSSGRRPGPVIAAPDFLSAADPAARYDRGPVIVPEYGTGAVTRIRSDTLGFCAASSALTASAVKLYEMVFTAPAAILTVPLSALA